MKKISIFLLFLMLNAVLAKNVSAQYTVVDNQTAADLANNLVGEGVVILAPSLTCAGIANGIFTGSGDLGIDSGIVLTSGRAMTSPTGDGVNGPYSGWGNPSQSNGLPGDAQLNGVLGITTQDRCILEFDFVPSGDSIKFNYVFASSEYGGFSCSNFNDVFAFFISGGAYATPFNMATIPGTTIPVCVNSTTGVPATPGPLCTSMGPGSPFDEYYIDNTAGNFITYGGFTTVFQAKAAVSPCDTYHLKLAIADGTDASLDSGVFIEAGSLSSPLISVETTGAAGLSYPFANVVRGCPPGNFRVTRSIVSAASLDIPLSFGGDAVPGVDYVPIPSTVIIPGGLGSLDVPITPLPVATPTGPKMLIINILNPFVCDGESPIIASDTIMIYDSLFARIVPADTQICLGQSVTLFVEKDSITSVVWTPSGVVGPDPTLDTITVSPTSTTTYTATVSIAGYDCPASSATAIVDVIQPFVANAGPDKKLCLGNFVTLDGSTVPPPDDTYTYSWSPAAGLSDPTLLSPDASPAMTTTYVLTVTAGVAGCQSSDSVTVRVLPNDINLVNNDTTVCAGVSLPLNAIGHPEFSYFWTPETGIANPLSPNTAVTATNSGVITVTATHEGCADMVKSFNLTVEPVPLVNVGPNVAICSYDTVQLFANVEPNTFPSYSYNWSPGDKLNDSTINNPVFNGHSSDIIVASVTTPAGCVGYDTIVVTVNSGNFITLNFNDTGICPNTPLLIKANGGTNYSWTPTFGLSSSSDSMIIANPSVSTNYMVTSISKEGCIDSQFVNIEVHSEASISMPDSVQIWPGQSYEMDVITNAHYFSWFPPEGLDNPNIANPIASPEFRTRYFLTATTEYGCAVIDSIDVIVNLESVITVPNAFVPGNSFANNATFKIMREGEATLNSFMIYNRWGQVVFSTTDINEGWDGKYNGTPQPTGVYVYQIDAIANGKPVKLTGNVTLVR